jgi:hypothetical protein
MKERASRLYGRLLNVWEKILSDTDARRVLKRLDEAGLSKFERAQPARSAFRAAQERYKGHVQLLSLGDFSRKCLVFSLFCWTRLP